MAGQYPHIDGMAMGHSDMNFENIDSPMGQQQAHKAQHGGPPQNPNHMSSWFDTDL